MKRTLFFGLCALSSIIGYSQDKYTDAMSQAITELYQAKGPMDFDPIINKFNRIGQAESGKWEASYYTALAYTFKSFRIQDAAGKDALLDQALASLKSAGLNSPNNSEILALEGFASMIKLSVDPATRGASYTPKIMATFGQSIAADPSNPRAFLFMAQMQIGTAQFFGTSIAEPCQMIQKSVTLFENYQPSSPLTPMWGKDMTNDYLGLCAQSGTDN